MLTDRDLLECIAENTAATAREVRRIGVAMVVIGIIVIALLFGGAATAHGEEPQLDKERLVEMALDFTQRASLFYGAAGVGAELEQHPDDVKLSQELGNRWNMAAVFVLAYRWVTGPPQRNT
jgi:hypothetical protein